MVVFANATAFTVTTSGDDLVTNGASTQINAIPSIESITVTTEFAWTVQTIPMDSSLTSGSALMGTTSGSNSSVDFTPDVSGDYEISVTATQGACTASANFALRAREACTSSATITTAFKDIQLNQRAVVTGIFDNPSGNETYEWRLTKPDGTEESLMAETFENQSGVVFGADAYFTPMTRGSYQLQFKVIDEDCEYIDAVTLRAIPQAFVLNQPKTTFVLDYVGDRNLPTIQGRHQYGDENSYQINPPSFGGSVGYKSEVSLLFPENMVEVRADCASANLGGCNWWDSTGVNEYMGNWTSSFTESSAVLLDTRRLLGSTRLSIPRFYRRAFSLYRGRYI